MHGSNLIVFVMARGGSTRIRLKNIVLLGGRPILSYTLEDVRDLQRDFPGVRCALMTDHAGIREAAESDGYRPANFEVVDQTAFEASDSREWHGIRRVLLERESVGEVFEYVMLLGADHVGRSPELLAAAYRRIQTLADPTLMLQSAVPVPIRYHPFRVATISADSEECAPWPSRSSATLSQNYPECYARTGGVFLVRRRLIDGDLEMVEKRVHLLPTELCLEIDTPSDLASARYLYE